MNESRLTAGAAIAAAATRLGLDSDGLADGIQVSRSIVASWMDGSVEPPERFHRRLEEELEFTPEELAALKGVSATPETAEPPKTRDPVAAPPPPVPPSTRAPAAREPATTPEAAPPPTSARRGSAMTSGRAIQEARRRKGWTTRELASAIHYSRNEIESWEDDVSEPWRFAIRAMNEVLDFTDEEADAVGDPE